MNRFEQLSKRADNRFVERMETMKMLKPVTEEIEIYNPITEAFDKKRHLNVDLLDIEQFVKVNELKEITNPVFFVKKGVPTSDGLLSNEIFGISKVDRAGRFAYIDLGGLFLHPLCYKIWSRIDKKIISIVHETVTYKLDEHGNLIEDPNGKTGVKFLKDNFDKIHIKSTDSSKRDIKITFLRKMKNVMFITKYPVIPAFYRDVDSSQPGKVSVGDINQMYSSLLNATRALKSSVDYGLTLSGSTRGRIQETLLNIYNWFSDEPQISKKFGILKRANLSKTTDYASRLVISAPNLHGERIEDVMVDMDHCALPLASALVNFFPFIMYYLTAYFNSEFSINPYYEYIDTKGELKRVEVDNWQEEFSPVNIKKQVDRFVHGYSNRLIPIKVPNKEGKNVFMRFKGRQITVDEFERTKGVGEPGTLINRNLTWCDLFFMAAVEVTKDKCVLITRYPIDSCYNQYPSLVRISSTNTVEPMLVNGTFYKHYPRIRREDIGTDTSNMFIDTLSPSNAMILAMGGDYDGDQITCKGAFFEETNEELKKHINSKRQIIDLGGTNMRELHNEGAQSIYNLTLVLPDTAIDKNVKLG